MSETYCTKHHRPSTGGCPECRDDSIRAEGAAEEREACAREAETWDYEGQYTGVEIAAAIRARGEAPDAIREHVKEGLADSAAGRVSSLGSFAQYVEDDAKEKALAALRKADLLCDVYGLDLRDSEQVRRVHAAIDEAIAALEGKS